MDTNFDPNIVPSLQMLVMYKVVQHSYRELIIKTRRKNANALHRLCSNLRRYVRLVPSQDKLLLSENKPRKYIEKDHPEPLSTSSRIQIRLQAIMDSLTGNIKEWFDYHMSCCAVYRRKIKRYYFFRRFDQFEFHHDGSIDYPSTARNILVSVKFNSVDKYLIACAYNFEEEIEQFWPQASGTIGTEGITFEMNPLQYYWTCRMSDRMALIQPIEDSRAFRMISLRYVNREWEMEYFWSRLSQLHKQTSLRTIFQTRDVHKMKFCANYLRSEEDDELVEQIVIEAGPVIMSNLVTVKFLCKLALPMWARIKNIFNELQFIDMYEDIFRRAENLNDRDVSIDVLHRLCIEIWNNAPDRLKRHVRDYFNQNESLDQLRNLVN